MQKSEVFECGIRNAEVERLKAESSKQKRLEAKGLKAQS